MERIAGWSLFFDLPEIDALTRGRSDGDVLASYREALGRCEGRSLLSRLLYLNARTYLLDDLLPKMDRMSMAHGLETRSPFLDRAPGRIRGHRCPIRSSARGATGRSS